MIIFSESLKKRALSRLGAPVVSIELEDEQLNDLFSSAVRAWDLYSSISDVEEKKLELMQSLWVENYFIALCKEVLSRVRGKYSGAVNLPGVDLKLDYESLKSESDAEKKQLTSLIVPPNEKIILAAYINVGNIEPSLVNEKLKKITEMLSKDRNAKFYVMAVRDQESRIECVYPNFVMENEMKMKLTEVVNNFIDKINSHE